MHSSEGSYPYIDEIYINHFPINIKQEKVETGNVRGVAALPPVATPAGGANFLPNFGQVREVPRGKDWVEKAQRSPLYMNSLIQGSLQGNPAMQNPVENFMMMLQMMQQQPGAQMSNQLQAMQAQNQTPRVNQQPAEPMEEDETTPTRSRPRHKEERNRARRQ